MIKDKFLLFLKWIITCQDMIQYFKLLPLRYIYFIKLNILFFYWHYILIFFSLISNMFRILLITHIGFDWDVQGLYLILKVINVFRQVPDPSD